MKRAARSGIEETLCGCVLSSVDRLWSLLDLVIQNINPDPEEHDVHEAEHQDGSQNLTAVDRFGNGIARQQPFFKPILDETVRIESDSAGPVMYNAWMHDPGLTSYFGCRPSEFVRGKCSGHGKDEHP